MTDDTQSPGATVHRYRLSREVLEAAPASERNLFLAATHVTNELNLLHKLVIWSGNLSGPEPAQRAQLCQSFMSYSARTIMASDSRRPTILHFRPKLGQHWPRSSGTSRAQT